MDISKAEFKKICEMQIKTETAYCCLCGNQSTELRITISNTSHRAVVEGATIFLIGAYVISLAMRKRRVNIRRV